MQRTLCFATLVGLWTTVLLPCTAFAPNGAVRSRTTTVPSVTQLHAIPALVKKAKLAEIERTEFSDEEMKVYATIQAAEEATEPASPGPLQQSLTRRKGTITVVPEFRRTFTIDRVCPTIDPSMFSSVVREAGATAISVLAGPPTPTASNTENQKDVTTILEEQRRARNNVPGSLPVIVHDVILDARQIARAAVAGASAIVLDAQYHTTSEALAPLVQACRTTEMECIVTVRTAEQVQLAVDCGATMLRVDGAAVDDASIVEGIPEGICRLGTIAVRNDQQLAEIEQAWLLRDQGYHAVWVSEVLYKAGEQPTAILKAMRSKSSLKWASPTARSGRGEGAREYLGDIMM